MEEVRDARSPAAESAAGSLPPWLEEIRRRRKLDRSKPPTREADSGRAACAFREGYASARAEVLQPDRSAVVVTRYFLEKWAPILGPTLTVIVLRLRALAAEHRTAREVLHHHDWQPAFPTQAELAAQVGVSEATIHRELKHPAARYFLKRVARYEHDAGLGRRVRAADGYEVAMDDPPVPEDEKEIALRAAERVVSQAEDPVPAFNRQVDGRTPALTLNVKEIPRGIAKNVNAPAPSPPDPILPVAERPINETASALADHLVQELDDPRSRAFYLRVAQRCPESIIWAALSETKDNHLTGRIRRSRGACFTDRVRRMAHARGVAL